MFQPEHQPIDHIIITYQDGTTHYVEKGIVGIVTPTDVDLSFCKLSSKEIVDFLVGMSDIGEEMQLLQKDVTNRGSHFAS